MDANGAALFIATEPRKLSTQEQQEISLL